LAADVVLTKHLFGTVGIFQYVVGERILIVPQSFEYWEISARYYEDSAQRLIHHPERHGKCSHQTQLRNLMSMLFLLRSLELTNFKHQRLTSLGISVPSGASITCPDICRPTNSWTSLNSSSACLHRNRSQRISVSDLFQSKQSREYPEQPDSPIALFGSHILSIEMLQDRMRVCFEDSLMTVILLETFLPYLKAIEVSFL
jgi:hypothetical protein